MKRIVLAMIVLGIVAAVAATTAFAAPPTPQAPAAGQGFGPGAGRGMMAPGTYTRGAGLAQGRGMGAMGFGRGGGMPQWAGMQDEIAQALGMSVADVQAARQGGKSLAQIAADKKISKDQLVSTILSARKADLDAAVKAGTLTQAQADAMYANMQQRVPVMVDQIATGPGCGGQVDGSTTGSPVRGRMMGGRWNR